MTQESFVAPTSIQIGLIKSRNLVSIRLVVAENWDSLRDSLSGTLWFRILNILPLSFIGFVGASLSPLQIALGYYALFANGGFRVNPHFIARIEDQSQHILYQAQHCKHVVLALCKQHSWPSNY